jgi:hypothetical protein
MEWEGCPEETLDPLVERAKESERKTWSTPAKTLADVLFRGEMAHHNNSENGALEGLNDYNGYYDTRCVFRRSRPPVLVESGRAFC